MSKGKKKKKRSKIESNQALALFVSGDEDIPVGYRPVYKCGEVERCANIVANLVSNMTIMLMQNGEKGDMRVKNNLSRKIDIDPCNTMDRKNFIFKIAKDLVLFGNSVVFPKLGADGNIENLIPISERSCSYQKEGEENYYILYGGNRFRPDEVLHFVYIPDLEEPFRGVGFKNAIIDNVLTLLQATETKKKFMKSKWKPSMILSIDGDAEQFRDEDMRKEILGSYVSNTEQGEPWIIPAGEITMQTVNPLTLNDLAVQDSINLDIKLIARAIGVPPFMVGIGEFNEKEYNNFITTVIMGIALVIQQQMTRKLLYSPNLYIKMNPKSLMQYDINDKTKFVKEMVGGGMLSRNEGRNEFDYTPADAEGMDEYIVLENYIPVSKVGDQKKLKGEEKG